MKIKLSILAFLILFISFINGCENKSKHIDGMQTLSLEETIDVIEDGHLFSTSFVSDELHGFPLVDNNVKEIYIYLPPSYYEEDKNYPVVYYLHGYSEGKWRVPFCKDIIDEAMKKYDVNEFIIVEVDGMNVLGGSFYFNSVTTGNNEIYVVNEVVDFVDENYRTIADPSARGIAGFSMGGFGALNIAFKHPDVFSSVLVYCPCIMKNEDLEDVVNEYFDDGLDVACGAAFSPNLEIGYPYAEIPKFNGTKEDNKIIENWENGMGNWDKKVECYLSLKTISSRFYPELNTIKLVYAEGDYFQFIPEGTKYLSEVLNENNIKHEIESFAGGHDLPFDDFGDVFVVFFSESFE